MKMIKKKFKGISYYVANDDKSGKQPIIVHIHGAGSRGNDLQTAIDANPLLAYLKRHADFPFKIYAPQCHANTWFDIYERLSAFIDFIQKKEKGATLYLTGISMGGYCAWSLLQSKPTLFRKAIICCGGGMYWNAGRIKTPVRAFHGKLDSTVRYEESQKMVEAVNASGGQAELTLYDELSHNVWDRVFSTEENYNWLLQ